MDTELDKILDDIFDGLGAPSINPKDAIATKKPGLSHIPMATVFMAAEAMRDGVEKYGYMNWRDSPVSAAVYYNAMLRHVFAWFEGEDKASDSGVHHLGHAMACIMILLDAEAQGTLVDDRTDPPAKIGSVIKTLTRH